MNYAAALIHFPKITAVRAKKVLTYFYPPERIWTAELDELIMSGLSQEIAHEFISWRDTISVEGITKRLEDDGIRTITIYENDYPPLLKEINDPPPVLFVRGSLPDPNSPAVSIVGTRNCTSYGKEMAGRISSELAASGVVIVSGLALGVDGYAHSAALQMNGNTVAVLGSSVDQRNIYPPEHRVLATKIIEGGGAIISEYPPGFTPTLYSYPARNRIIAGLSQGTLVIEAPASSGALITSARALDYNREVFALPHPLTSKQGEGCNNLLKKGAALVTSAADIMEILNIDHLVKAVKKQDAPAADPVEASIFEHLKTEPRHVDELSKLTGLKNSELLGTLTLLEMKGKIRNLGGMRYTMR